MRTINLESKTNALPGEIESYWFENESIGLKNTLFHRITIPLSPFDSGLEYEQQPVETAIVFDWYKLNLKRPEDLDGINLSLDIFTDAEASVYIGGSHNWCHVKSLEISLLSGGKFRIKGNLLVEFENEDVANNEPFCFETTAIFRSA